MKEAYALCVDLYGECRCLSDDRAPCDAMVDLAEEGETADGERERMEAEREAAAEDW